MGLEKYVSEPREILFPDELVFAKLSDLRNLEKFVSPEKIEEIRQKAGEKGDFKVEDYVATEDRCSFKINPLGQVGIEIIERDPFKTIKFQGEKTVPFPVTFWIQLVPLSENSCKIRLTLHAEMNPMIKMMVNSYVEKGIGKMAELLSGIDYSAV
jgi:hypothetical protein